MNPQDAIDLSREAIKTCMMVGGPILIISLLIGLLVGVFQAMTQVQDQTVSFVPKILLLFVAIGACLPWLTDQMIDFARFSFEKPYTQASFTAPVNGLDSPLAASRTNVSNSVAESVSYPVAPQLPNATIQPPPVAMPTLSSPPKMINPHSTEPEDDAVLKSPFMLPHYRFSRTPKTDIDG